MELTRHGHDVRVQSGAGLGPRYPTPSTSPPVLVAPPADEVWGDAEMVLKVKEPVAEEHHRSAPGRWCSLTRICRFARVHRCHTRAGATAIAHETVELPDGSLPLLALVSEVAGRLAPQVGSHA